MASKLGFIISDKFCGAHLESCILTDWEDREDDLEFPRLDDVKAVVRAESGVDARTCNRAVRASFSQFCMLYTMIF